MNNTQNPLITHIYAVATKNNLKVEKVAHILADSFKQVYLKEFPSNHIQVEVNLNIGQITMWRYLKIVSDQFYFNEGDEDDETLIPWSKAEKIAQRNKITIQLNDFLRERVDIDQFDKKFVRSILSIFNQLIIETVNRMTCDKWIKYKNQVIWGKVEKIDIVNNKDLRGAVVVLHNDEGETTQAYITKHEMIQTTDRFGNKIIEKLEPNQTYLFYIKDVHEYTSGWPVNLTRTSPEIVRKLMTDNISEISDGTVEIKAIARIAGQKSKVAVWSNTQSVDPVGACIGPGGKKIKQISNQLLNEKIDVIEWSDDPIKLAVNCAIPGKILGYSMLDNKDIIFITDPASYLSLIGKKGTNIKLISSLTGWNIDVKTVVEAREEDIDYQLVDENLYSSYTSLSERIFHKHQQGYSQLLDEFQRSQQSDSNHDFDDEDDQY
ncbi:Transcription termination protein NusA [[Mycoplasma] cavipharyngis]|uniref:transcription termination factor NusA n=1 Tax=[Mycoplasma] cavipharyngis TaxID=92757 RepID=UPI003703FDE3